MTWFFVTSVRVAIIFFDVCWTTQVVWVLLKSFERLFRSLEDLFLGIWAHATRCYPRNPPIKSAVGGFRGSISASALSSDVQQPIAESEGPDAAPDLNGKPQ